MKSRTLAELIVPQISEPDDMVPKARYLRFHLGSWNIEAMRTSSLLGVLDGSFARFDFNLKVFATELAAQFPEAPVPWELI